MYGSAVVPPEELTIQDSTYSRMETEILRNDAESVKPSKVLRPLAKRSYPLHHKSMKSQEVLSETGSICSEISATFRTNAVTWNATNEYEIANDFHFASFCGNTGIRRIDLEAVIYGKAGGSKGNSHGNHESSIHFTPPKYRGRPKKHKMSDTPSTGSQCHDDSSSSFSSSCVNAEKTVEPRVLETPPPKKRGRPRRHPTPSTEVTEKSSDTENKVLSVINGSVLNYKAASIDETKNVISNVMLHEEKIEQQSATELAKVDYHKLEPVIHSVKMAMATVGSSCAEERVLCDNTSAEEVTDKSGALTVIDESATDHPASPKIPEQMVSADCVNGDTSNKSKPVTEICACDTTTGSTEDDQNVNSNNNQTSDESNHSMIEEPTVDLTVNEKSDTPVPKSFGRREWCKQLTQIRMRLREKKRLIRQRAIQARKKFTVAKKANKELKSLVVDSKEPVNEIEKSTDSLSDDSTKSFDVEKTEEKVESIPINNVIGTNVIDNKVIDNNVIDTNACVANDGFQREQPVNEIIEIVESDGDDDDEDPWPFQASPEQANSPNIVAEGLSSPSSAELPPNGKISAEMNPTSDLHETADIYPSGSQSIKEVEMDRVPVVDGQKDNIKQNTSKIRETDDYSCIDAGVVSPVALQSTPFAAVSTPDRIPLETTVHEDDAKKSAVELDKSIDSHQNAKMHSRSCEKDKKDMVTNSMWRDMFSSDIAPLDFDDSKIKSDSNEQKLPDILEVAAALNLTRKSKITVPKTQQQAYDNTPSGDSYPVTSTSLVKPVNASTLTLCICKSGGVVSPGRDRVRVLFCQAVDTTNGKAVNCVNKVSDKAEFNSSIRVPKMVLCKYHRKKLSQHASCPVCGLFCTAGEFIDCMPGKGHYHHSSCQVKSDNGEYLCPHCGATSAQAKVTVTMKKKPEQNKTKLLAPNKKDGEGIARMCIRLVTKPTQSGEDSNSSFDSKLFEVSKSKLLDGAEKTKLINVLTSLDHLIPVMRDKLDSMSGSSTMYDLSSYILKNDISQLVLGICEIVRPSKCSSNNEGDILSPLDKQFAEQSGKTLLHLAVQSNSLAAVHCLIVAGACPNSVDNKGSTPLMLAARNNFIDILKYLIGSGAYVEWRDLDGMTALHMAAVSGHKAICDYLLCDMFADVNSKDDGGWTPLVWAIENGHSHVVRLLLNCGANIHCRDNEGNVSIHWGAYSGNTEIIKLLIAKGADIEAVNELGDRPLHIAVRQARTDAVILLLSQGADTSAINNVHQTPAECCHGACSENMRLFLTVNNILRSCKLDDVQTRSARLLHQDIARGKEKVPIPVTNDVDDTNYPTDFTYVTESVWTSAIPVNNLISSLSKCSCTADCNRASCQCARASIACWYAPGGVLSSEFDFTNPPHIYECNKACGCWMTCSNRVVQHGISAQLELFKTKHRGWGVRARHEIPRGSFVCEYVGELITDSKADEREDDSYLFDLENKEGDTYCMDAKHYGNISRFINHRCEPNLTPISVFIDHQDIRFPRICLFANTTIPAGEELGFDYGERFWLVKYKHFLCDCGCKSCKYNKDTINQTLRQHDDSLNKSTQPTQPAPMKAKKAKKSGVVLSL